MDTPKPPERCSCGDPCYKNWIPNDDPCEGPVEIVDEVWDDESHGWVHACEKHAKEYGK
jgi:hypothetical protein